VVSLYDTRTPLAARHVPFHRTADVYADQKANAQLLRRMLSIDALVRMPVELEEALVLALPEPMRTECLRELADRYGLLAAPKPCGTRIRPVVPAGILRETGEAVIALAQVIDQDAPRLADLQRAASELIDVIAHCTSAREQILDAANAMAAVIPNLRNLHA
jgi:hypothetical protein